MKRIINYKTNPIIHSSEPLQREYFFYKKQDFAKTPKSSLTIKTQRIYSPKVHPNQLLLFMKETQIKQQSLN